MYTEVKAIIIPVNILSNIAQHEMLYETAQHTFPKQCFSRNILRNAEVLRKYL